MTFAQEARAAQVAWKHATSLLPEAARGPGDYCGTSYDFCLPQEYASLNLMPDAARAVETFARAGIPWHRGVDGGPTNHLCSSQVQCVNALAPFALRPDALRAVFGAVLDIAEVLPFGDPLAPDDCVAFEWIGDDDPLEEWTDGVGTRGAHNTSADAAIRYATSSSSEEIALIEWKYTEQYIDKGELKTSKTSQATRDARYRHLYDDPDGPLLPGVIPYEDFYVDPVYQLFRLSLLAWRLETTGAAERVRVVYCAPGRNTELWKSLNRESHRAACEGTLGDLWKNVQRRPDRFVLFDTAALVAPDAPTSTEFKARYRHIGLVDSD